MPHSSADGAGGRGGGGGRLLAAAARLEERPLTLSIESQHDSALIGRRLVLVCRRQRAKLRWRGSG